MSDTGAPLTVMVGALNADLGVRVPHLPRPGETVNGTDATWSPGGKAANQAVAAARLGGRVRLVGAVGDDAAGRGLLESAAASGVDVGYVRTLTGEVTGQAIIPVDDAGENSIVLVPGANGALRPEHLDPSAFVGAAVVTLSLEVGLEVLTEAALFAREVGALTVFNPSPLVDLPDALGAVDVMVVNELEARQLAGDPALDLASERDALGFFRTLQSRGVRAGVVTLGERGAVAVRDGVAYRVPSRPVSAIDTTGCGDAFAGALATSIAEGIALETAAREAALVAAFAATRRGAQSSFPTATELAEWLRR